MSVALSIPESPIGWLLAFCFVFVLSLAWYLGAKVIARLTP